MVRRGMWLSLAVLFLPNSDNRMTPGSCSQILNALRRNLLVTSHKKNAKLGLFCSGDDGPRVASPPDKKRKKERKENLAYCVWLS